MTLIEFAALVATNNTDQPASNHIEVTATHAPDLSTGLHWIIEWTGADNRRHREWAQDLDVLVELAYQQERALRT